MALGEDGEEIPASVTLSGDLSGDSWRGTLTVAPDADDTAGLTATFRLTRAPLWNVDSTPKQEKQGGGISGRGKQGGAN